MRVPSIITATIAAFAIAVLAPTPATAQDQDLFGAGLAFDGDDLFVVKRAAARGPAALFVYRMEEGTWQRVAELRAPGAVERGLALSPAVAASNGVMLAGSGDPDGRWGAHTWSREGDTWTPAGDLAVGEARDGEITVSLETVMRILQPAPRSVAVHSGFVLVGLNQAVHLFRRGTSGWETVPVEIDNTETAAVAVALGPGVAAVGHPSDGNGSVTMLAPGTDGVWRPSGTLEADAEAGDARFGAALTVDGSTLVVGAPGGSGAAIVYERGDDESWSARARLNGSDPSEQGFGTAVALRGNELLVSAPNPGVVHRFVRSDGEWTAAPTIASPASGGGFGAALAISPNAIAVGAPMAVGGRGRAWVFPRMDDGFGLPIELSPPGTPVAHSGERIECTDGTAGGFRCDNVDLDAFLPIEELGGSPNDRISDLWGWTDEETGREYALLGLSPGLVFVDITEPAAPRIVGRMPANSSGARDIKVYRNHAFMTGDGAGEHGLMVFDLTRLRNVSGDPVAFEPDAVYDGIASAHNLAIDTESGLAVPVSVSGGGETCGGGLHMVDITTPTKPTFAGCYTDTEGLIFPGRTHDAQCVIYRGPDTDHQGRNICFASNETALRIVDVTDRANPMPLSAGSYPGAAYIHQGWLTEDQRYFYLDDELDELVGTTTRTRTLIWDVNDLDDPVMVGTYLGPDGASDHNLYVKGDRMYQANYQAGFRVIDISDPEQPREVGYFDTTPYEGNPAGFYGAWTAFPFFESGTVIVSSMQEGLFVVRPRTEPPQ